MPSRRTMQAVAAVLCALGGTVAAAPAAAAREPLAVVAYYNSAALPRLVDALNASSMPASAPVYFGNYWGSPRRRGPRPRRPRPPLPPPSLVAGPRYRYAPLFSVRRGTFWERRRLLNPERRRLGRADPRFRGRIPSLARVLRRGARARFLIGRELGRRFRDRVRARGRIRRDIATWQFDEIPSEAAGRQGRRVRDLVAGILTGLTYGRPRLGDRPMRGIVYMAQRAAPLARRGRGDARRFWRIVERASIAFVGEEYPAFTGSPVRAARVHSRAQRRLRAGGGPRRALARRYVVGMTPGYKRQKGLGGNVRRRSRASVRRWRRAFVRARARRGAAGFAQFNFRGRNGSGAVMREAVEAIAEGVRRAR